MADIDNANLVVEVPPEMLAHAQGAHAAGAAPGSILQSLLGFFLGRNVQTIYAIGSAIVQDVLAVLKGQPVYGRISGIRVGDRTFALYYTLQKQDDPPPATAPSGAKH